MAFPRKDLFAAEDQRLSVYARAMCHPARIEILRQVHRRSGMYVQDIERFLPLGQAAVSDHLRVLREAGLLDVESQGRYNYYTVNLSNFGDMEARIRTYCLEFKPSDPPTPGNKVALSRSGTGTSHR